MGGDDSQKLLPWRGTYSSPGRSNLRLLNTLTQMPATPGSPMRLQTRAPLCLGSSGRSSLSYTLPGHFRKADVVHFSRAPKPNPEGFSRSFLRPPPQWWSPWSTMVPDRFQHCSDSKRYQKTPFNTDLYCRVASATISGVGSSNRTPAASASFGSANAWVRSRINRARFSSAKSTAAVYR